VCSLARFGIYNIYLRFLLCEGLFTPKNKKIWIIKIRSMVKIIFFQYKKINKLFSKEDIPGSEQALKVMLDRFIFLSIMKTVMNLVGL